MKNATKGALAAAAAGSLLLGGAGSLAYWTGTSDISGGSISSGNLVLTSPVCDSTADSDTHDWQYDTSDADFHPGTDKVVPGDTITKVCKMTLTLTGGHIGATLGMETPTFQTVGGNATLDDELAPTVDWTVDGGTYAPITSAGTYEVLATVNVDFDGEGAENTSKNLTAVLNDITLTATQTHDTAS